MEQEKARAKCVCRLEIIEDNVVKKRGTGFHYGGGWIITNSHVIGENASNLSRITITFDNLESPIIIIPEKRICFFMDILYDAKGEAEVHKDRADVAFFLIDTQKSIPAINEKSLGAVPSYNQQLHHLIAGDKTYCLHYGWGNPAAPPSILTSNDEVVTAIYKTIDAAPFIIERIRYNTSKGSSGSPLFEKTSNQLVGIHYATGKAVMFSPTISTILNNSNIAITNAINLPSMITTWLTLHGELKQSAWTREIAPRIKSIIESLRLSSPYMRLGIPLEDGSYEFYPRKIVKNNYQLLLARTESTFYPNYPSMNEEKKIMEPLKNGAVTAESSDGIDELVNMPKCFKQENIPNKKYHFIKKDSFTEAEKEALDILYV